MSENAIARRVNILQLALNVAYKEHDGAQEEFDNLHQKLSIMAADGDSLNEIDHVVSSMLGIQAFRDEWQRTIEEIRDWQDEVKEVNYK